MLAFACRKLPPSNILGSYGFWFSADFLLLPLCLACSPRQHTVVFIFLYGNRPRVAFGPCVFLLHSCAAFCPKEPALFADLLDAVSPPLLSFALCPLYFSLTKFFKLKILTAPKVGIDIKKDIFTASNLLKLKILAPVMVMPDLLTPGINDKI